MVREEKLSVEIVPCEIYREEDGLAMSSRNRRLDAQQRKEATLLYRTLVQSRELLKKGAGFEIIHKMADEAFQSNPLLKLEYFEIAEIDTLATALIYDPSKKYRAFIAAFAGPVRLIDNIALN
jgi:pantoate--beta-alanine ligase